MWENILSPWVVVGGMLVVGLQYILDQVSVHDMVGENFLENCQKLMDTGFTHSLKLKKSAFLLIIFSTVFCITNFFLLFCHA